MPIIIQILFIIRMMITMRLRTAFWKGLLLMTSATSGCTRTEMSLPRPGTYHYQAHAASGPAIDLAQRVDVSGTDVTIRQSDQTMRYRLGADGLALIGMTTAGREVTPAEPMLFVPWPARVGQKWTQTTDVFGAVTLKIEGTVLRFEDVTVAEHPYPTVVVEQFVSYGGPFGGREHNVIWHSADLGIAVRIEREVRAGGATGPVIEQQFATLTSLPR
jgi:hypothetical protein